MLTLYFLCSFLEICRVTESVILFIFYARFFCLSPAENAPPVGCPPAGGAFSATDKQKNRASKVNKHLKI